MNVKSLLSCTDRRPPSGLSTLPTELGGGNRSVNGSEVADQHRDGTVLSAYALAETSMSPSLPTDILDLIADHLHDEPTTLRACCLVSKSWVPRTRRHLFAFLEFDASPRSKSTLELWMKAFPDPSNSPARYTRGLHLARYLAATVAISKARRWVHSFNHFTYLAVTTAWVGDHHISFPQLRGLSPSLKSLRLSYSYAPLSELLALICSFPFSKTWCCVLFVAGKTFLSGMLP